MGKRESKTKNRLDNHNQIEKADGAKYEVKHKTEQNGDGNTKLNSTNLTPKHREGYVKVSTQASGLLSVRCRHGRNLVRHIASGVRRATVVVSFLGVSS